MAAIHVYYPKENEEQISVLKALHAGIPGSEYLPLESYTKENAPDVAVICGMYKQSVPYSAHRGRVFEVQRYLGKNTLVVSKGFIERDRYYSVGWNGLNNKADFLNTGMGRDRLPGVRLAPWRTGGEYFLIAGQIPWDANLQDVNFFEWVAVTALRLQRMSGTQIVFRPHPEMQGDLSELYEEMVKSNIRISDASMKEDLAGAKAVISYNSNLAVDAVLAGVPTITRDIGSMAWPVSGHHFEYLMDPELLHLPREEWLNDLSYAQWTLEEMASGATWEHLNRYALKEAA